MTLKREIAKRLSDQSWPIIDATLNEFSFPISTSWNGDTSSYVLKMIENAPDDGLSDLARHLGFNLTTSMRFIAEPDFWKLGMFRLFISHLATHKKTASELQRALLDFGISSFVAHKDIKPTREWENQIEFALSTCDALVALLHDNFHKSNWTDQEIGFAMGRGVPVCSVRFGQTPYGFIGRFQAFDGNQSPIELAEDIFDAYLSNKQTQKRMSAALISLFEQSGSYAEAKARVAYLEKLEEWETGFAARIHAATNNNSQIRGSFGVPERVKRLVQRWTCA